MELEARRMALREGIDRTLSRYYDKHRSSISDLNYLRSGEMAYLEELPLPVRTYEVLRALRHESCSRRQQDSLAELSFCPACFLGSPL